MITTPRSRRNCSSIAHPVPSIERFSPFFCFTFLPGFSTVPFALAVIPLVFRSSRITSVEISVSDKAIGRKSFLRMFLILRSWRAMFSLSSSRNDFLFVFSLVGVEASECAFQYERCRSDRRSFPHCPQPARNYGRPQCQCRPRLAGSRPLHRRPSYTSSRFLQRCGPSWAPGLCSGSLDKIAASSHTCPALAENTRSLKTSSPRHIYGETSFRLAPFLEPGEPSLFLDELLVGIR